MTRASPCMARRDGRQGLAGLRRQFRLLAPQEVREGCVGCVRWQTSPKHGFVGMPLTPLLLQYSILCSPRLREPE